MSGTRIPLVYIAGPYRAECEMSVARNIAVAEDAAKTIWQAGGFALCPHKNTAWFGGLVPDQMFLDGDMEALRRCDLVVTCGNWRASMGATAEVAEAKRLRIPVIDDLVEARAWIATFRGARP